MSTVTPLHDMAERTRTELAFRTSQRWLRSILDNTPAAVSVKGRDHRYRLVNDAFERRFGLEPGWILGRGDEAILEESAAARDRKTDDLVFNTGQSVEHDQTVMQNGRLHVYHTIKFALRDKHQHSFGVCGVISDVTERTREADELADRVGWTERIQEAAMGEHFVLYGQPIVDLASGAVAQAELLIRMRSGKDSPTVIPPSMFLPAAERFDLVATIDLWVVAKAIALANEGHHVEVNLSGKTVSDAVQVAEIERLVSRAAMHPENIIFEITETAVAHNLWSARRFVDRLRALGCLFALDDFGVGFGAFIYLKHLPVDYLKIDLQFVRDLTRDARDRCVVESIVGVAKAFGIKTVAEGVEDQRTLDLLSPMGVDFAQGYWIGGPLPVEDLWARDRRRGGATREARQLRSAGNAGLRERQASPAGWAVRS